MKAKMNINQISLSIAAFAVFFMSAAIPVKAGNEDSMAFVGSEYQAAQERLDIMNLFVEESVMYTAPVVAEEIEAYDIQAANERLDDLSLTVEVSVRYQAPMVNEDAEAYEVAAAKERLDNLALAIEESIKF